MKTEQTLNHRLDRDGPLAGIYHGLTERHDGGDETAPRHLVALLRRKDGQEVALHLDSPELLEKWAQERPQSGQQVGVYRDGRGRVDVVRQRTDALDPLDSEEEPARTRGGKIDLPERRDDKMMLEAQNAAYLRAHPGVGEPVSEHQATPGEAEALRAFAHHHLKPAATMPAQPAGPALSHYARPTRGLGHPGQNFDLSRPKDYLQGLADGATDSWQAALAEAEARLGSGDPGAEMTRS